MRIVDTDDFSVFGGSSKNLRDGTCREDRRSAWPVCVVCSLVSMAKKVGILHGFSL